MTALTWAPLGLEQPGLREVIPSRRPDFPAAARSARCAPCCGRPGSTSGAVCARCAPRGGILFHGMDGFLPYALRRRDRCVATVHDLGWQVHPELYARKLRVMYGALFPWVLRRADRIIAVSRYTADDLIKRAGVAASRIEVIYHGLDPEFAAASRCHRAATSRRTCWPSEGSPRGRTPAG